MDYEPVWMTKDGARKQAMYQLVKDILESEGWVVEGEEKPVRASRKRKDEDAE